MFDHRDTLEKLNGKLPLIEKLKTAHTAICEKLPFIVRIAIAVYDPDTRVLKTYLHSSGDDNPLPNYQTLLDEASSLKEILERGRPRVINNLLTFEDTNKEHTQRIGRSGYVASYTLPMFNNGEFMGFLFFNSDKTDVFDEKALFELDLFGHLISLMVINELTSIRTLSAAVKASGRMTHLRDPETGSHLDRMSRYSRLIAASLAEKYQLDDSYIEHVFMFAPLHDIGKIAIPDSILLKPGPLDEEEQAIMRTHTQRGKELIDDLIDNFGLEEFEHVDILRNIAEHHHEAVNGSGYPRGISLKEIPLEARIVATADIFDALTSKRPYKEAWSNDAAITLLRELAGEKLDSDCVEALVENLPQIEIIQKRFREDKIG
ncbi:MAG: HD domain-containing protein [Gammaproteobacteria bacterium]|nr:HD domain-containing protein [Gammaproteobacteria bacterium]